MCIIDIQHGHVDAGCLFGQRNQVSEGLEARAVANAELGRCRECFFRGSQG